MSPTSPSTSRATSSFLSGRSRSGVLYGLLLVFSACSISYELILARLFSIISSREIVWHSVTIAVYVLALGVGTKWAEANLRAAGPRAKPLRDLLVIEILLCLLGALSVYGTWKLHTGFRIHFLPELVQVAKVLPLQPIDFTVMSGQILCFAIGVLSGFELPLLAAALERTVPSGGSLHASGEHGSVLAANYIGTLLGTLAFLFVMGPTMSLGMAAWWTASINLLGALFLYLFFEDAPDDHAASESHRPSRWRAAGLPVLMTTVLAVLAVVGISDEDNEQMALKATYYLNTRAAAAPDYKPPRPDTVAKTPEVVVRRSPYQTLHIVRPAETRSQAKDLMPGEPFTLYIDRHFQISSQHEGLYHEFFVHYPISVLVPEPNAMPRQVLVLGGGDGLAARELLKYPEITSITQVELDPMMIDLAHNHPAFRELNHDSQHDPRVHVIEADAFTFLKTSSSTFDAIFIDFPYPYSYDLSRLYSLEFYTFVNRNLREGGFVVFDMPLVHKNDPNQGVRFINDIFASTLAGAGFENLSPFGGEGELEFDLETFMIARRTGDSRLPPLPSVPLHSQVQLNALINPQIRHYGPEDFELRRNPQWVNSIFRPALLSLRNTFL